MITAIIIGLVCLAAVCKAFADTLDHHFDTSIFRYLPRKVFDPNVIHKTAPKIFGYPLDAWHISNTIQICSWIILTLVYEPQIPKLWKRLPQWLMDFGAIGIAFIIVFGIFYNKLFRKK